MKKNIPLAFPALSLLLQGECLRIGGITYYMHSGKIRACPSKRERRDSRTDKEVKARGAFTAVRRFWSVYRRAVNGLKIWSVAACERGRGKSDSLFHSVNAAAISPEGKVWAYPVFRFAEGSLAMPVLRGVEREGWTVRVAWEEGTGCVGADAADRLYVGYFYEEEGGSPCLLEVAGATRGDGSAEFTLPAAGMPDGTPLHLYFFFSSPDGTRFSPSVYLAC